MTPLRAVESTVTDGASSASLNGDGIRDASAPVRYSGWRLKPGVLNCCGSVPT
jgi:hypothetical protein